MVFTADHRNVGGMVQINQRIQSHHSNLNKMKSTINTRIKPKKNVAYMKSVRKNKSNKIKYTSQYDDKYMDHPEFDEVKETFKRACKAKTRTDTKKPKTMKFLGTFLKKKPCYNYELDQHYRNLASLHQRLGALGSPEQRKKNPYDPISHPSLFFRRVGQDNKSTNLGGYEKKVQGKYKVNKAVHDLNKAIIDNDYYFNFRDKAYEGASYYDIASRSVQRPYSSKPIIFPSNLNSYAQEDVAIPHEEYQQTPLKRPRTGKNRSMYYEYSENSYSSGKKTRARSKSASSRKRKSRAKKRKSSEKQNLTDQFVDDQVPMDSQEEEKQHRLEIPVIAPAEDALEFLKSKLFEIIISQRLTKKEDLEFLFEETYTNVETKGSLYKANMSKTLSSPANKKAYNTMVDEIKDHIGFDA